MPVVSTGQWRRALVGPAILLGPAVFCFPLEVPYLLGDTVDTSYKIVYNSDSSSNLILRLLQKQMLSYLKIVNRNSNENN